ncbi:Crp/Fnr family transcriptional regulator [Pseudomonas sp.]|uniref:Crp/Fnr family transcriptional regulator n=1 Tax=Pseudomonas sp. TaxID=306 RepID=UPI00272B656E|nr:Crp/Fnr family transcriptional regulator [Pseudomonas sp.]
MRLPNEYLTEVLRHPLLALFDSEAQAQLLAEAQYRDYYPLALIFRQADPAERFFLVLRGKVKLFRISADGKEKVVEVIQAGQTFAEAVMFLQKPVYPVCAETLEPVHLISFSNRLMLELLQQNPQTCLHMLGHLSIRLHQRLDELENLTLQNATQRFALYLVGQVKDRSAESAELDLHLPKGLIAARLSIQPETLSRVIGNLRQMGLIEIRTRHISIPSISRLLQQFGGVPA